MPELVNKSLGVTVSVSEAVATGLGPQWASVEKPEPEEKPAPRRRVSKSDD